MEGSRRVVRSFRGLSLQTTKSADLPGSMEPVSFSIPAIFALPRVAVYRAWAAVTPQKRRKYTSSRQVSYWVTKGQAVSVPRPTGIPADRQALAQATMPSITIFPLYFCMGVAWLTLVSKRA